jgi:hypothetical protein
VSPPEKSGSQIAPRDVRQEAARVAIIVAAW